MSGGASSERPLERLFDPRSVVVIGATDNQAKWGYQYCRRILEAEDRRRVFLVNHNGAPVLGRATLRSIEEVPEAPDVAVICVPRDAVLPAVHSAGRLGVKYLICVTAGFAETGPEGRVLQERVAAAATSHGMRLVGPNCLGLVDTAANFHCTAFWDVATGPIGIVSQSGTVLLELGVRLSRSKLGLSRGVSIGNQADLQLHEYMEAFIDEPNTRIVVAYVEEFKDGRAFMAASERLVRRGKPVVLVVPFGSEAVERAVSSHTGSLVSGDAIINSAATDAGIVHVSSISDMMLALSGLCSPARARGKRIAVLADGGGCATLGAGVASQEGMTVPAFSEGLRQKLREVVTPEAGISNPVDYVKALNLEVFVPVVERVARSGEVDGIIVTGILNNVLPGFDAESERRVGRELLEAAKKHGAGLVVSTVLTEEPAMDALREASLPVFDHVNDAARSLLLGREVLPRRPSPPLPEAASRLGQSPDYSEARALLGKVGIPFPKALRVTTREEALSAGARLGFPLVLKGLGSSHKSDSGAVRLGLADAAALAQAFDDMARRLAPPAFSVEEMADGRDGVEILVGALRDRGFGATIAVGLGGVLTEVLKDTVVALAPVDQAYAEQMLSTLKGAALLRGYRGKPPVDMGALASLISAFSEFVAMHPEISEAELNPVLALPRGAIALDSRIVVGGAVS